MRVKKFVARSLPEAMAQVKAELGPDAVILHTTDVKVGGFMGMFGNRMIQVMAAVDPSGVQAGGAPVAPPPPRFELPPAPTLAPVSPRSAVPAPVMAPEPSLEPEVEPEPEPAPFIPAVLPAPAPQVSAAPTAAAAAEPPAPEPVERLQPLHSPLTEAAVAQMPVLAPSIQAVREDVADVKALINEVVERMKLPSVAGRLEPELRDLMAVLIRGGLEDEMALTMVNRVRTRITRGRSWEEVKEIATELMTKDLGQIKTVDQSSKVIALVGPTGVGKTTTLAKLAAHLSLQEKKRVALVTADTFRIGAVEQLRTYSQILGVPLEVVYEPEEASRALDRYRDRDVILFDTAGRSPRNLEQMNELKRYLEAIQPASTYLVLSLTSAYRDAMLVLEQYLPLGMDHFLFTKWDETLAPGLIYNVIRRYKRPLSYITTGQTVPDDIVVADPTLITRAILGD